MGKKVHFILIFGEVSTLFNTFQFTLVFYISAPMERTKSPERNLRSETGEAGKLFDYKRQSSSGVIGNGINLDGERIDFKMFISSLFIQRHSTCV